MKKNYIKEDLPCVKKNKIKEDLPCVKKITLRRFTVCEKNYIKEDLPCVKKNYIKEDLPCVKKNYIKEDLPCVKKNYIKEDLPCEKKLSWRRHGRKCCPPLRWCKKLHNRRQRQARTRLPPRSCAIQVQFTIKIDQEMENIWRLGWLQINKNKSKNTLHWPIRKLSKISVCSLSVRSLTCTQPPRFTQHFLTMNIVWYLTSKSLVPAKYL